MLLPLDLNARWPQGVAVYEKNYHEILFRGLNDTVYEVRKISAAQVGAIVENFGGEWAQKFLLPEALKMFDVSSNYLHRIVPLQIISVSCPLRLFLPPACLTSSAELRISLPTGVCLQHTPSSCDHRLQRHNR